MKKYSKKNRNNILIVAVALAVLIPAAGYYIYQRTTKENYISTGDKTTSTAPSAQENFTEGSYREVNRTAKNEGRVEDTSGNVATIPSQNEWSSSATGAVTVYSPAKKSIIKSGDLLSGSSNLPKVSYRLIDDVSGVIAQGSLSVINGKFSGTFNFSTTGTTGRLDIYSANADGVESSNIEIPVRFK